MDKRNGSFKGSPTSRGTVGSGVGGVLRGNGDIQMHRQQQEEAHMANSRSLGMLTGSPNTEGVVHGETTNQIALFYLVTTNQIAPFYLVS